ncbi:hypothetical protein QN277_016652 [Acacia crassicarpa]|uniref:PPC domain-containing protein n=1 Tax=Acacia crassicarpa TaxID=499986 RepID=A0AAE1TBT1_9FABA|nr:hypothetical protein QN277_016652 [Acacia crassicarpa]
MANHIHGFGVSFLQHPQPSNNDSFEQYINPQSLAALSKGTELLVGGHFAAPPLFVPPPWPGQFNIPGGGYSGGGKSSCRGSGNNTANMRTKLKQTIRKPKGRPPGSKNKPKPEIMDEQALKHAIIEIPAGCDVVEELIKFAEIHNVGLTVLSGSGSVTNVTLSHTLSNNAPSLTLNGTFVMLSLSGTYVKTQNCSSSSLPPNPSSFPGVVSSPGFSCFTMCLAGTKGEIFGGVIAGKIIAASLVVVVAALYKKPMFHRVLKNNKLIITVF